MGKRSNLGDKIRQNIVLCFLSEIFNCAPSFSGESRTAQGLGKPAGSENAGAIHGLQVPVCPSC